MKTQVIEFNDGEMTARIVVSAATALQGSKRARLTFEAGDASADPDAARLRGWYYPICLAAARSVEIDGASGDPDFETFASLPEALVAQWFSAALDLNPHWLPQDVDEKKVSS